MRRLCGAGRHLSEPSRLETVAQGRETCRGFGEAVALWVGSLDHLIGTWTEAEADELDAALEDFETIDESAE